MMSIRRRHGRVKLIGICVAVLSSIVAISPVGRAAKLASNGGGQTVRRVANLGTAQSISRFDILASDKGVEDKGMAALSLVRFNYQDMLAGWTIAFLPPRDQLLGLTLVNERRVEIYVRKSRTIDGLAHDISHEFGHVMDVTYNSDALRDKYLTVRGVTKATSWWICNSCRDLEVGAGDFAEVFAEMVGPKFTFYSQVKGPADAATLETIRTQILPKEFVLNNA